MVIVHLGERYDVCPVSHPKRQGVARKFVLARKPMTSVLFTLGRYDVLLTADRLVGNGNFYIRAQSLEGDLDAQVVEGVGDHVALGVLRYHSTSATADNAPVAESAASVGGLTLPSVIERHIQKGNRGAYEYVSNVTGKAVSILNCFDVATPSSDGGPSTCVPVTALTTHAKWRHAFDALVESESRTSTTRLPS